MFEIILSPCPDRREVSGCCHRKVLSRQLEKAIDSMPRLGLWVLGSYEKRSDRFHSQELCASDLTQPWCPDCPLSHQMLDEVRKDERGPCFAWFGPS